MFRNKELIIGIQDSILVAMLRSARKLFDTEATVDETGTQLNVLSDHRFTEGQYLSLELTRLVLSDKLIAEVQRRDHVVSLFE